MADWNRRVERAIRLDAVHVLDMTDLPLGAPDWVEGEKLKAVIMGGSSVPVLTAEESMNVNLDYESLNQAGTFLGSGGMIIIPERCDMVEMIQVLPPWMVTVMMGATQPEQAATMLGSNLIVSNVHGSDHPLYIAGARLETMYPMSILTSGGE